MFKFLAKRVRRIFNKDVVDYDLVKVRPVGAPTFSHSDAQMIPTEGNQEVYEKLVRERKEVITPSSDDTAEDLASLMSQAACDREFPRVIVYPVEHERRVKVLEILEGNKRDFPMYEYLPANIVNNDDLDSKTIIYKFGGRTHRDKLI
jgi:hypothetical protein